MESPRKFNDCYFYYYSTCTKGDNCVFRHEPSALGCETMCTAWQQGKCLDKRCKLRHMELRKNRKQIPCYWENQPGGCRKKHCPFMHKNPEARTDGIAPSQPVPCMPMQPAPLPDSSMEPASLASALPQPVPLLWQQQRQVVLESGLLGVGPAGGAPLGALGAAEGALGLPHAPHQPHQPHPPHAPHAPHQPHQPHQTHQPHQPHPHRRVMPPCEAPPSYAALPVPVDPLVVNFDEESDNESAPSSTPSKRASSSPEEQRVARTKSQELLLLERIQAEAAAYYSYDSPHAPHPPPEPPNERKIVRTNLSTKYDRLSLDEISGKKQATTERRNSLDFKVLSLEEIRANKKSDAIIHSTPITLNLNRKRKISTQETITTTGSNKIIKLVRSTSIVYKKVDEKAASTAGQNKTDQKQKDSTESRKRTLSEQSDIYDIYDDELIDNCYEFKRIKIAEQSTNKPRLIRNRHLNKSESSVKDDGDTSNRTDNDSDSEVQIVSVDLSQTSVYLSDVEVVDVDYAKMASPVDIVDLSDDDHEDDSNVASKLDGELNKNVPDVVASCQKKADSSERDIFKDIDAILDDEL